MPGWPVAFRGSVAVAAGVVTWDVLRGKRYARLFPDTYVDADRPNDLRLRSHAAYRYVEGRGVLAGWSAAEVLGAACAPRGVAAEVVVPGGVRRPQPGLLLRRDRLLPAEIVEVDGLRTTSPLRTAYDLARRGNLVSRVVALDALARVGGFHPDEVLDVARRHPRARGNAGVAEAVGLADAGAGSPMETRLRLVIVRSGLPRPRVQVPVQDESARTAFWLDLGYPDQGIGVEYDGLGHTDPTAVVRDIARHTALLALGWRVYRYTRDDVLHHPARIVDQIRRALAAGPTRRTPPARPIPPAPITSGAPAGPKQIGRVHPVRSTRRDGPDRARPPG